MDNDENNDDNPSPPAASWMRDWDDEKVVEFNELMNEMEEKNLTTHGPEIQDQIDAFYMALGKPEHEANRWVGETVLPDGKTVSKITNKNDWRLRATNLAAYSWTHGYAKNPYVRGKLAHRGPPVTMKMGVEVGTEEEE